MRTFLLTITTITLTPLLQAQGSSSTSLWSMIQQGGWAMYPLALCSLALIYIAIHCSRETRIAKFAPRTLVENLSQLFATSSLEKAASSARSSDTVLGRTFSAAIPKLDSERIPETLESFETEIGSLLTSEEDAISQWVHYLSVIANVAPMVGLLGTVSGMIGGFQTMSAGGMGRPELFAGDIGEALITTATGLCIGIPAMVVHSVFNNRLSSAIAETTRQANTITDSLPTE